MHVSHPRDGLPYGTSQLAGEEGTEESLGPTDHSARLCRKVLKEGGTQAISPREVLANTLAACSFNCKDTPTFTPGDPCPSWPNVNVLLLLKIY